MYIIHVDNDLFSLLPQDNEWMDVFTLGDNFGKREEEEQEVRECPQ